MEWKIPAGLREFLQDNPLMGIKPSADGDALVAGRFDFSASHEVAGIVCDSFDIQIRVPRAFPRELPMVVECGGRVPREANYHVNEVDGTLCLGSPLTLLQKLYDNPTLSGFAKSCLVPYLYGMSHKLSKGWFPFGELAHGKAGIYADYMQLLAITDEYAVYSSLKLLGMKKRLANKQPCPCGCSLMLGRCKFNQRLKGFRALATRKWYRNQAGGLEVPPPPSPRPKTKKSISTVVF